MEKITGYMRAHPWATGIIVVVGGFIFIMLVRGGSGGSGSVDDGPSDAEIAANAQIQAAQIQAQASAAAAGASIQQAQIGAGVQMNSDKLASEVAMRSLDVQQTLGLDKGVTDRTQIEAESSNVKAYYNAQTTINSSNNKQKTAGGIIGAVGSIAGGLLSIFSDSNLKDNIRYLGKDDAGRNVYEFNYKGSKIKRSGYIAQDIARSEPERVTKDKATGYLKVNTLGMSRIIDNATESYPLISLPVLTDPFTGAARSF